MIQRLKYILRRRWGVLVGLMAVGLVIGALAGPRGGSSVPMYEAKAVISADQAGANETEVQQDLVRARKGAVAADVATKLGGGVTPGQVTEAIQTDFDLETFVSTVTARASTLSEAERYAKTFAEVFVADGNSGATAIEDAAIAAATSARDDAQNDLQAYLEANAAALAEPSPPAAVLSQRASLETAVASATTALTDLRAAARPVGVYELVNISDASPVPASKLQVFNSDAFRAILGLLLGLGAAVVLIAIVERANPRIDDQHQAEELVGAPVLAMVPVLGRRRSAMLKRVDPEDFRGPYAEAFRTMRAHLDFRASVEKLDQEPRIMVTSATPSEGKSTTAAFLAMSYAESERRPVVIGGDLRRPSIHRLFGIGRVPGLTTRSLPGGSAVPLTSIVRRDALTGVTVVPSGPSVDHVNDVMGDLLAVSEVAQASGQVVILDTAPVRVANDAIDFLAAVDWVIVVIQAGHSTKRSVAQMMRTLRMNGAHVVGVAMVGSAEAADATRDYYSYYAPEIRSRRERRRSSEPERPELVVAS